MPVGKVRRCRVLQLQLVRPTQRAFAAAKKKLKNFETRVGPVPRYPRLALDGALASAGHKGRAWLAGAQNDFPGLPTV